MLDSRSLILAWDSWDLIIALIAGLCVGSFANVVASRLPKGLSVLSPPSFCFSCDSRLKWRDMLPIASFVLLRGCCRHCKAAISRRYPIVEGLLGVFFVMIARHTESTFDVLLLWGLAFVLLCISLIDMDTLEILDGFLIFGTILGILWIALSAESPGPSSAALGVVLGALPLYLIDKLAWFYAKKPGFGLGDVKLMAMCGLFLGTGGIAAAYFFAFVSGGVFAVVLLASDRSKRGTYFAFGPFLSFGVLASLLR